jgi:LysM repeat protein
MGHHMKVLAIAVLLVAVMAAVMPTDTAEASGSTVHCVRAGETLFSIGRMYGVSPWTIAYHNGLANPNYIVAGQVLRIPGHGGYQYLPGRCHGCQPKPQPPVYHPPVKPPFYGKKHCVRFGETLFSIGRMYGVSPWSIARVNGLANPNYIRAGTWLTIPSY